jgi:uncharacterized membrane protein YraQ (UPF0718 family)
MPLLHAVLQSLLAAVLMFWDIFWALILGFALSAIIMVFVPKAKMTRLLGRPGVKAIGLAAIFGAASSSCSYAAASMTRSIQRKGAHIIPALAFLLASTNLVVELSSVLWILLGWQFVVGECLGGLVMIAVMATLMKLFGPLQEFREWREREAAAEAADKEDEDNEETHRWLNLASWRAVARAFVSEWRMIGKDIAIGMLISGFLMTLVPDAFWASLFLKNRASEAGFDWPKAIENALVGPLVSMVSFVCSIGNIPLASVLYRGGIGFGGTLSFIYADLIIIPLILVYRKYYGWRLALWITGIFYVSMALTGLLMDVAFTALGWVPKTNTPAQPPSQAFMMATVGFRFNATFWFNLVFAGVAVALVLLARSGEPAETDHCCH